MQYYIFLVLAVLFWSGNFVFGRLVSTSVEPLQLSFFRWFFVVILLAPYLIFNYKRIISIFKKDYLILIVLGSLGIAGFNTFLYFGLETTEAINALLINSFIPIMIVVFSSIILKERVTKIQLLGILVSTLGVAFLITKGELQYLLALEFSKGDLWILTAGLCWSFYSIFLKFKPKEIVPFDFLSITTFIGVIILSIAFFNKGYSFNLDFVSSDEVLYSLIYIIIFPSILSFYFWNTATVEVGANKAGQFAHLMPIFGSVLAYIFLDERLQTYHLIGAIFIATGIYLSIFYKKRVK